LIALAIGLRADAGFAEGFAAGDDFGAFAGFVVAAGLAGGLVARFAVELRETRFDAGLGFGSVMEAPPRDAVDQ